MIDNLLCEFWAWLGISRQEYLRRSVSVEFEEYMFPKWSFLINETFHAISREDMCIIPSIMEVMALDNESENVLDYLSENATSSFLDNIYMRLPECSFHHARWQGAELIQRRPTTVGKEILYCLISDENSYVKKRAQNSYFAILKE